MNPTLCHCANPQRVGAGPLGSVSHAGAKRTTHASPIKRFFNCSVTNFSVSDSQNKCLRCLLVLQSCRGARPDRSRCSFWQQATSATYILNDITGTLL